jgi:hypothetical protein
VKKRATTALPWVVTTTAQEKAKQVKTKIFAAKNVRSETLATKAAIAAAAAATVQAHPICWLADENCIRAIKANTPVTTKQNLTMSDFSDGFCRGSSVLAQNFRRILTT